MFPVTVLMKFCNLLISSSIACTETALVKILNDILLDIDRNRTVILLLLDLSAAQLIRWIIRYFLRIVLVLAAVQHWTGFHRT